MSITVPPRTFSLAPGMQDKRSPVLEEVAQPAVGPDGLDSFPLLQTLAFGCYNLGEGRTIMMVTDVADQKEAFIQA